MSTVGLGFYSLFMMIYLATVQFDRTEDNVIPNRGLLGRIPFRTTARYRLSDPVRLFYF